jgi:glutamine cyclotransferase
MQETLPQQSEEGSNGQGAGVSAENVVKDIRKPSPTTVQRFSTRIQTDEETTMKRLRLNKKSLAGILVAAVATAMAGTASATSLYVIASWDSDPNPINAYDIQGGTLVYQSTGYVPSNGYGAMGLALAAESKRLFVTYEASNIIEMIDAETFAELGSQAAAGASDLAGIVVDQEKELVYAVDRGTRNLYVYDVTTFTLQDTVTLPSGNGSYGIALDGDNLAVGDFTTTVRWYDTTSWAETSSVVLSNPAVDVAVDIEQRVLYATHYTSANMLTKYDLNTDMETSVSVDPNQARGVDVDQATGLVYVTVGEGWATDRSEVRVYTSALTLSDSQAIEDDATGLVVPVEDISFNRPPECDEAYADPDELWPPNHKFRDVSVAGVTDPDGDPVAITITAISQDEPLNGIGDGNTSCPDGAGVGTDTASVRAERSGSKKVPGDGRIYHVGFMADDGKGGQCTGAVTICVPHDQRRGHVCVDQGPLFDSTAGPYGCSYYGASIYPPQDRGISLVASGLATVLLLAGVLGIRRGA